jgi:putative transposase
MNKSHTKGTKGGIESGTAGDLCLVLGLDSISKDVALTPFWNDQCQELQSTLFLPSKESGSSNFTETQSEFWQKTFQPKTLTQQPPLVFSLPSATPRAEEGVQVATRKIRIYPNSSQLVDRQIDLSRWAYNECIGVYRAWKKGDRPVDCNLLRQAVRWYIQEKCEGNVELSPINEACQEAKLANQAVIRKRTKGMKAELSFRKKNDTKQGFILQKLWKIVLPKKLGTLHITEVIPPEAFGKMARVIRENGRYFLLAKVLIPTAATENQGNAVGIDPGVRTFATTAAQNYCTKLGENFQKDKLKPLGLRLDRLYSRRKKLFNNWSKLGEQYRDDTLRCYNKKIDRLKSRRNDLIEDLHKRICFFLVDNYEFIFLPTFAVKQMTNKAKRKIGTKVVGGMMDLCHHKFKLRLAWMCKKYGKTLVEVNEAFTSQTQSWDGTRQKVGRSEKISDGRIVVDRDINAARGIFLRAITRQLTPQSSETQRCVCGV